jgi:creatinase/prolidase-like protein
LIPFQAMRHSRRQFLQTSTTVAAAYGLPSAVQGQRGGASSSAPSIAALKPFPGKSVPISVDERKARIEKARRLMTENGMGAIVLEPGTSMTYFVDVRWGLSERPFLVVIPAKGELAYVSPGFEEARAREITKFTNDVRVWQETRTGALSLAAFSRIAGLRRARLASRSGSVSSSRTGCVRHRRMCSSCWRRRSRPDAG